jgi:hypothetical protein
MSNITSMGLGCGGGKSMRDRATAFVLIVCSSNNTVALADCSIPPGPARNTFAPLFNPTKHQPR